jgi:hypothetical protein
MMVTRNMLGLVAAVAGGAVFGLLMANQRPSAAVAQIPDQGAQLLQLIDETKSLNTKMDRLVQLLEGGKLEVRVKPEDAKPAR